MDQLGALIGAGAASFIAVLVVVVQALRGRSSTEQATKVADDLRRLLLGKDDPTPRDVAGDDTGVIALAMRSELKPVLREQRRQARLQELHGEKLELVIASHEAMEVRQTEISAELEQLKADRELDTVSERLRLDKTQEFDKAGAG